MRVLVAEDHSLFRDGIISLLEAAGFEVVGEVGDGLAAVEAARRLRPDLVLMDISMPGMDGLAALRLIKKELPEVAVVMLTVSDDDAHLLEAVESGAAGYLQKDLTSEQVFELLRGVQSGEAAMTRRMMARLMKGLVGYPPEPPEPPNRLTGREVELLRLVSRGMSNRTIAQTLSISDNTVKYHMRNVFEKLGVQNRAEAVAFAIRANLLDSQSSGCSGPQKLDISESRD